MDIGLDSRCNMGMEDADRKDGREQREIYEGSEQGSEKSVRGRGFASSMFSKKSYLKRRG